MSRCHASTAITVLLSVVTLAACSAGTSAPGRAGATGLARSQTQETSAGNLPLPAGTVSKLPAGTFYLMAGPSPFRYGIWKVTASGGEQRIGPAAGRGSGVRSFAAATAGVAVSAASSGIDYLGRLTAHGVYWLPGGRIKIHGFAPQISADGLITYQTPPGPGSRHWAIWTQRSFAAHPRILYKQSAPLGSPAIGLDKQIATFTAPYTPHPGKIQSVIVISRRGRVRRIKTGYQELGELLWQPNAAALVVVAPGCHSELLSLTGRKQQLPEGWCPYAWSPDGRMLLMLASNGTSLGIWSADHPKNVSIIGLLNKHIQIGQISWLAHKARL